MLRNRKTGQQVEAEDATETLVKSETYRDEVGGNNVYQDEDEAAPEEGTAPPLDRRASNATVAAKAGRFFMNILYAINDLIPGINLVPDLTADEVRKLEPFKQHVARPFNSENEDHMDLLRELWSVCTQEELDKGASHVSERWKNFGFQGTDPATDFRGGGVFSLKNLLYFQGSNPELFDKLLKGGGGVAEIPLCIAGINITMMLDHLLHINKHKSSFSTHPNPSVSTTTLARKHFFHFILSDAASCQTEMEFIRSAERTFGLVYTYAFETLDRLWRLEQAPSIMNFNAVLFKVSLAVEDRLRNATSIDDL